jgi:hypothetical protein
MTLRSDIRSEVQNRLNDTGAAIWTAAELNGYIANAIGSLYPTFWTFKVTTSTAGDGPLQDNPSGARNIYFIGLQKTGSTRVRLMRQWREGDTQTYVPKTGISGQTLVWAWTQGFTKPTGDVTALDIPQEAEEIVVVKTQITALERVLSSRVETAKYFALTVREGVTEVDLVNTLDALHATLQQHLAVTVKLPERQG